MIQPGAASVIKHITHISTHTHSCCASPLHLHTEMDQHTHTCMYITDVHHPGGTGAGGGVVIVCDAGVVRNDRWPQ